METYVEFRSNQFPPTANEEAFTNPGIWGKSLASYLSGALQLNNVPALEPIAEDWGWIIPIKNDDFRLWIGCSNYSEFEDGFLCFIEPHTTTIRRWFRKIDTSQKIGEVRKNLDAILRSNASVHGVRWRTHEEFNDPRAPS